MSVQLSHLYLIEKVDLVKSLMDDKKEIENYLMDKRFLSTPSLKDKIVTSEYLCYSDKNSSVFHMKRLHDFRISMLELDIGLKNHLIIHDKYDILKNATNLVLDCFDIHTGCSEWREDVDVIIDKNDLVIDDEKITAEDLLDLILDYESNYPRSEKVIVDVSATHHFSIIDGRVVDNMIWRLIQHHMSYGKKS